MYQAVAACLQSFNTLQQPRPMDATSHCIELFINTWIGEFGELFDFNAQPNHELKNFKSFKYALPLPQGSHSQHYYFMHLCSLRPTEPQFYIERRQTCESKFDFRPQHTRLYKLVGCFKLFAKRKDERRKYFVKMIQTSEVKIWKGYRDEQRVGRERPYIIARSFRGGYPLKEGQTLKLGKVELQIQEVVPSPQHSQLQQSEVLNLDRHSEEESTMPNCKVCYDPDLPNNPLIKPCECTGQIGRIHVVCLKTWIHTKLTGIQNQNPRPAHLYNAQQLFCQICRQPLPKKIVFKGHHYHMLSFLEDFSPYIAFKNLAVLNPYQDDVSFVTVPENGVTRIGRKEGNGVMLTQNSVSKDHALIRLHPTKSAFVIEDTKSKYGTLVYDKDAQFRVGSSLRAVSIGKSVFSFKLLPQNEYPKS